MSTYGGRFEMRFSKRTLAGAIATAAGCALVVPALAWACTSQASISLPDGVNHSAGSTVNVDGTKFWDQGYVRFILVPYGQSNGPVLKEATTASTYRIQLTIPVDFPVNGPGRPAVLQALAYAPGSGNVVTARTPLSVPDPNFKDQTGPPLPPQGDPLSDPLPAAHDAAPVPVPDPASASGAGRQPTLPGVTTIHEPRKLVAPRALAASRPAAPPQQSIPADGGPQIVGSQSTAAGDLWSGFGANRAPRLGLASGGSTRAAGTSPGLVAGIALVGLAGLVGVSVLTVTVVANRRRKAAVTDLGS